MSKQQEQDVFLFVLIAGSTTEEKATESKRGAASLDDLRKHPIEIVIVGKFFRTAPISLHLMSTCYGSFAFKKSCLLVEHVVAFVSLDLSLLASPRFFKRTWEITV